MGDRMRALKQKRMREKRVRMGAEGQILVSQKTEAAPESGKWNLA